MSKKYLHLNLNGLTSGEKRIVLGYGECLRRTGDLMGVIGEHFITAKMDEEGKVKDSKLVEEVKLPLDELKVDPFMAMEYDIKTNLTPEPFWDMDGFAATDMLEGLCNGTRCSLNTNNLPKGIAVIEVEE